MYVFTKKITENASNIPCLNIAWILEKTRSIFLFEETLKIQRIRRILCQLTNLVDSYGNLEHKVYEISLKNNISKGSEFFLKKLFTKKVIASLYEKLFFLFGQFGIERTLAN